MALAEFWWHDEIERLVNGFRWAISFWTSALAAFIVATFVVVGLGTVIPVFMENSLVGMSTRSVVAVLCLAVFITSHRRRSRQVQRRESGAREAVVPS